MSFGQSSVEEEWEMTPVLCPKLKIEKECHVKPSGRGM